MKRKIKSAKGFTLAELLIVVAIIAVLVAIGIPIFTSQLEKSREAVDLSDVRSAYAEVMMAAITGDTTAIYTKGANQTIYNQAKNVYSITVKPLKQKQDGWQTALPITIGGVSSTDNVHWVGTPGANGECVITYIPPVGASDEAVKFEWKGGTSEDNGGTGGNGGGVSGGNSGAGEDNGNTGENGGTGDNNNSGTNSGNSDNEINYTNVPVWDQNKTYNCNIGDVFLYKGKYYIALTTKYAAGSNPGPGGWHEYSLLTPNGTKYTSKDVNDRGVIEKKIVYGDMYIADDGTVYICKGRSDGGLSVPTETGGDWVAINKNQVHVWGKNEE